jgi:hypothetical protein
VVFDRGEPEQREEGGHVYEVIDSRGRSVATTKAEEVSQHKKKRPLLPQLSTHTHTHIHTHTHTHTSLARPLHPDLWIER